MRTTRRAPDGPKLGAALGIVRPLIILVVTLFAGLGVGPAFASEEAGAHEPMNLTMHWLGFASIAVFVFAYALVMAEEFTHLRKSKPVLLAAGIIWGMIGWHYATHGLSELAEAAVKHNILEYGELFLFLLVAMTYINAMEERGVFHALRTWLIKRGFGYRTLFWLTGWLAFFISPIADNLTTALLMCAVVMAVGVGSPRFVALSCVNIVVAANAGGAFSPFGDITTLMVWQKGIVSFWTFFHLFIPSVVNFVVPAALMFFAVPKIKPAAVEDTFKMKYGARTVIVLFLLTIATAVTFHNSFGLPPVVGMMTGLSYLQIYGFVLRVVLPRLWAHRKDEGALGDVIAFDVFRKVARAEWDTLLFFYGVVLCVGGLAFIGYLAIASQFMYVELGPTTANVLVGILSAIVDNIPVMFAILTMNPDMPLDQWLLVTLTTGVGGSLLSIGSAAGVALMGQARGTYTFFRHLKWTPAIALGYAASIWVHFLINGGLGS